MNGIQIKPSAQALLQPAAEAAKVPENGDFDLFFSQVLTRCGKQREAEGIEQKPQKAAKEPLKDEEANREPKAQNPQDTGLFVAQTEAAEEQAGRITGSATQNSEAGAACKKTDNKQTPGVLNRAEQGMKTADFMHSTAEQGELNKTGQSETGMKVQTDIRFYAEQDSSTEQADAQILYGAFMNQATVKQQAAKISTEALKQKPLLDEINKDLLFITVNEQKQSDEPVLSSARIMGQIQQSVRHDVAPKSESPALTAETETLVQTDSDGKGQSVKMQPVLKHAPEAQSCIQNPVKNEPAAIPILRNAQEKQVQSIKEKAEALTIHTVTAQTATTQTEATQIVSEQIKTAQTVIAQSVNPMNEPASDSDFGQEIKAEAMEQTDAKAQLAERIRTAEQLREKTFIMQLKPESLGKITVTLNLNKSGMSVTFQTEKAETKVLLQEQLPQLQALLKAPDGKMPVITVQSKPDSAQAFLMQYTFSGQQRQRRFDQPAQNPLFYGSEKVNITQVSGITALPVDGRSRLNCLA